MQTMVRHIFVVLCFALAASLSRAQPARIDSMLVDETKGELIVFGDLGPMQGFVFVDSVSMPVVLWTDSFCRATIPVNGKGSAGLVEIGARGYRSDGRMLTGYLINYRVYDYQSTFYGGTTGWSRRLNSTYHYRISLETALEHNVEGLRLECAHDGSNIYDDYEEANGVTTHTIDTTWASNAATLLTTAHKLSVSQYANLTIDYGLSPAFLPLAGADHTLCGARSHGICKDWDNAGSTSMPRKQYAALSTTIILSPGDSAYLKSDTARLSWTSENSLTSYEIQESADSLFTTISLDSTSQSTTVERIVTATHFYRARGQTEAGHTRWSNTAIIRSLGLNAVLNSEPAPQVGITPNPCNSSVSIHFPNISSECILFDLLGRAVERIGANGELRQTLDVSMLAEGLYFARVFDGKASSILQFVVKR